MIRAQSLWAVAALLILLSCTPSSSDPTGSTTQAPEQATEQPQEATPEATPDSDQSDRDADTVDTPTQIGAASWALVDGVPAYRKPGLLIKAGLNYQPVLDAGGVQTSSRLMLDGDRGMFALAHVHSSEDAFDQLQLVASQGATSSLAAFVITEEQQIFIFADSDSGHCETWATPDPFTSYGLEGDVDGIFGDIEHQCLPLVQVEGSQVRIGSLPEPVQRALAVGVLIDATAMPGDDRAVDIEWLALADSNKPVGDDITKIVTVRPVSLEDSVAYRSTDPDDDQTVRTLSVREFGTGVVVDVELSPSGVFEIDRTMLSSDIVQISLSDYGEQFFPSQGSWIDLRRLDVEFVIDLAPPWQVQTGAPPESDRVGRPHSLSVWNGSTAMDAHEYRGLTFTNNLGRADRDRLVANPNECRRIAYLGGSWVEAIQTRVDQKPGVIAEAILDSGFEGCHEVFTDGRDTLTVENHYDNARDLVETYGVEVLIFSISAIELCRMDDEIVLNRFGKALETPPRWRLIDGEMVAPVSRGSAIDIEVDPDFDASARCNFKPAEATGEAEAAVITKLRDLQTIYESLGPGVEVRFVNVRDPFTGQSQIADHIAELCASSEIVCQQAEVPFDLRKPEGVDDHSPWLYRYLQDAHPNARANQAIARVLVDLATAGQ